MQPSEQRLFMTSGHKTHDVISLQELGDLRNIMESIAYLRRPFTWATYCNFDPHVQEVTLTRLDNLVTVIAGRARSLLKAGFIIQAEYLLKTLRTRNTENVREIEAACECLRQTSSGSIAYDDDQIYLRSMVGWTARAIRRLSESRIRNGVADCISKPNLVEVK